MPPSASCAPHDDGPAVPRSTGIYWEEASFAPLVSRTCVAKWLILRQTRRQIPRQPNRELNQSIREWNLANRRPPGMRESMAVTLKGIAAPPALYAPYYAVLALSVYRHGVLLAGASEVCRYR